MCEFLGISGDIDDISEKFMSSGAKGKTVNIYISSKGNQIIVYIPGTDASAEEGSYPYPNSNKDESCIYSGTITGSEVFE